jgi:hypothetical protein
MLSFGHIKTYFNIPLNKDLSQLMEGAVMDMII